MILSILKSYAFTTWDKIAKTSSVIYGVLILKVVYIWLRRMNSINIDKVDLYSSHLQDINEYNTLSLYIVR